MPQLSFMKRRTVEAEDKQLNTELCRYAKPSFVNRRTVSSLCLAFFEERIKQV